jgi:tryptophan synthase alpha chain
MGRIENTFRRLSKSNEAALIPCITVGHPSPDVTRTLLPVMARQGVDLIMLAGPATGPAEDQPSQGVTLAACLEAAAEARRTNELPLLLLCRYDQLLSYGTEGLVEDAAASGLDGLLVPDLLQMELDALRSASESAGIDLILTAAPASTEEDLRRVAEATKGFVMWALPADPAGADSDGGQDVELLVSRIRKLTDLPVVVWTGANTPQGVAQVSPFADGVVVGSGLAEIIGSLEGDDIILGVSDYLRALKEATYRQAS